MTEREVFEAALELAAERRAAFLDGACGGDAGLRQRLEALLRKHDQAGSFLEGPVAAGAFAAAAGPKDVGPRAESVGQVLAGRYKLVEEIGEGGMGTVWMAQQQEPVKRLVALKVIKAGMDSWQVVARFEAERQALALMDHPNIAKVLDAGATGEGRPYFVMELVKGVPITKYCDEHQLAPRQRLELFVGACSAVQHAHQKGIIHRDLKPSNVLVAPYDGKPVVKVIDFGVAKALGEELTDKTLFTAINQMIGTPLYMSPEQAGMSDLDIDTRSDIYSLGVLLYELLTGTTPFDKERFKQAGYDEIRRIIREEEPPRPSTRISTLGQAGSTISAQRQTEPAKLTRTVRGELDWIVMKALDKDRNRRYETANGFAMDVQRYLADEPVQACPPSVGYRLRKFLWRNRVALTFSGLVLAIVLTLTGGIGWNLRDLAARQAEADWERAARLAQTEQQMDQALLEAAFLRDQGDWPMALAAAQRAEQLLVAHESDPHRQRVRAMLADLKMATRLEAIRLGNADNGGMFTNILRRENFGLHYAEAFRDHGMDILALDAGTAAERIRASAIRGQLVAALDEWLWSKVMQTLTFMGRVPNRNDTATSREQANRVRTVANLVDSNETSQRIRDCAVQRDAQALDELAGRPALADVPASAGVLLARLLRREKAPQKAVAVLYAVQRRSPADFLVNGELAWVLFHDLKPARAEEAAGFMRAAVALRPKNAQLHYALGNLLHRAGQLDQASAAFRQAIDLNPKNSHFHRLLGKTLEAKGDWDEAIAVHRRFVALNPKVSTGHYDLGRAYRRAQQWDKAIAAIQEASRLSPNNATYQRELAWLLATSPSPELRNAAQAVERATIALQRISKNKLLARWSQLYVWRTLGVARYRAGDWDGAIAALEQANRFSSGGRSYEWYFLAMARWRRGDQEQARQAFHRAVQWRKDNKSIENEPLHNEELDRFRAEAAKLLRIEPSPSPPGKKAPTKKP